ncbi:MAG: ParB-like nuclease domain-containing protein [Aeriscardovia sp.]|nr:ParB-like nuclease domain-containing protein [Aeriscardovia sp.]
MEERMGRGLKALFPNMPGEAYEEKAVSLGRVSRRRSSPSLPKRGVDEIFSPSFISWKAALISVGKIQIPEFIDLSRGKEIEALKKSIASVGLLYPVLLSRREGTFELAAGYRRLLAFKELGMKAIPARTALLNPRDSFKVYRESNSV